MAFFAGGNEKDLSIGAYNVMVDQFTNPGLAYTQAEKDNLLHLAEADLRRAWKLPPILSSRLAETGTIHRTVLLETAERNYALRAYRYTAEEYERIISEHAIISYVQEQGLPVPVPLLLPDGKRILEHEGHFYALFPFAIGEQVARDQLTVSEAIAMGKFLGKVHLVLRRYSSKYLSWPAFTVDLNTTLMLIDQIEETLCARPKDKQETNVLSCLAERRAWLAGLPERKSSDFGSFEQQAIHGDYQETNLFFSDGQVSAVIDWDKACMAPRAWEVVRTLHYAFKLVGETSQAFLYAYQHVFPLVSGELDRAAAMYGWMQAYNFWPYKALYLEGNQRVRTFLRPQGPYVPFEEHWADLQDFLQTHQAGLDT